MKTKLFTVQEFDSIVKEFIRVLGDEAVLCVIKHSIIGAIIDTCFFNKQSFVYGGNVYAILTSDRNQEITEDLAAIKADTITEWALTIKLGM